MKTLCIKNSVIFLSKQQKTKAPNRVLFRFGEADIHLPDFELKAQNIKNKKQALLLK